MGIKFNIVFKVKVGPLILSMLVGNLPKTFQQTMLNDIKGPSLYFKRLTIKYHTFNQEGFNDD